MFHVYVDPLFGDNQKALELNPTNPADPVLMVVSTGRPRPLDRHRDISTGTGGTGRRIEGFLQHAPYSFKTLSSGPGGVGAVEYVQRLFVPQSQPNPAPILPWANPGTGMSVTHVVIHCLPGLYGPILFNQPNVDPGSGLPWNGELFPIQLGVMPADHEAIPATDRISIQGTSALDTIFDARGQVGPAIEFTLPPPNVFPYQAAHAEAFIDGVTVRGVTADGSGFGAGAAIHVRGNHENWVTVSNCFLVENSVGIAVNSDHVLLGGVNYNAAHQPRIVNNTFVDNVIGVWVGDLDPNESQSLNTPALLNNLFAFDDRAMVASCFEGLREDDVKVATVGVGTGGASPPVVDAIYNAWDAAKANTGLPLVAGFPASPVFPLISPRVDTGLWRLLFVRDVFDAAGTGGGGHSPHDYRLSPNSRPAASPGLVPTVRNPLIDTALIGAPVAMANGVSMPEIGPGLPAGAEEVDMTARDWDAEGFGNPRVFLRDDHPDPLVEFEGMDFGADEVGNLIVAGYLPGTRIFSLRHTPVATTLTDHLDIYFFDALPAGVLHPRPNYNSVSSFEFGWYDHVINKPDVPVGQGHDYVQGGVVGSAREEFSKSLAFPANLEPFMRNLRCDMSPHVALDLHPFWPDLLEGLWLLPTFALDVYASNPWYSHMGAPGSVPPQPDNPSLYHNRGGLTHSTDYLTYAGSETFVAVSALNPPLTLPLLPPPAPPSRLFPLGSVFSSMPGGSGCVFGALDYSVDIWGMSNCPDRINPLGAQGEGTRFNLESVEDGERNLQTFLLVPAISIVDPAANEAPATSLPSREELRWRLRHPQGGRR